MKRTQPTIFLLAALLVSLSLPTFARTDAPIVRLLLIDETKTIASTMRIVALVKGLRGVGGVEVDVRLADVASAYDDPLADVDPEGEPYDIVLIIPRGIDDGSVDFIWLVSLWLDGLAPHVRAGAEVVTGFVDQIFDGVATTLDVYDDLFAGFLWALYEKKGWVR